MRITSPCACCGAPVEHSTGTVPLCKNNPSCIRPHEKVIPLPVSIIDSKEAMIENAKKFFDLGKSAAPRKFPTPQSTATPYWVTHPKDQQKYGREQATKQSLTRPIYAPDKPRFLEILGPRLTQDDLLRWFEVTWTLKEPEMRWVQKPVPGEAEKTLEQLEIEFEKLTEDLAGARKRKKRYERRIYPDPSLDISAVSAAIRKLEEAIDKIKVLLHEKRIQAFEAELADLQKTLEAAERKEDDGLSRQKRTTVVRQTKENIRKLDYKLRALKREKIEPPSGASTDGWTREIVPGKFREVVKRFSEDDPIPSRKMTWFSADDIRCYREVVSWTRPFSEEWRIFENEVIKRAVGFLFCPLRVAVKDEGHWTELHRYAAANGRWFFEHSDGLEREPQYEENQLILKTGGGQIGGSIISGGDRGLTSFDGPRDIRRSGGGGPDNDFSDAPDYDPSDDSFFNE